MGVPPDPPVQPRIIDFGPAWSPTGDTIAYTHYSRGPDAEVWFISLSTGARTFATVGMEPTWSPDGSHLAYVRNEALYSLNILTRQERQLAAARCHDPAWSPDGTRIAFDWDFGDPIAPPVIWLIQADGSNARNISQLHMGTVIEPAWSPDGALLMHIRAVTGVAGSELFVMDTTGGNVRRITVDSVSDLYPSWSPDGSLVAWVVSSSDPSWGIWVMRADGSDRRRLIDGSHPSWSPDGTRIVFARNSPAEGGIVLWIIDADGRNAAPIPRR